MKYLIMCKSLTTAQRGALLLERHGISASVVKAPQHLRGSGCGYALSLYRNLEEAATTLLNDRRLPGKMIRRLANGEYLEVGEHDLSR